MSYSWHPPVATLWTYTGRQQLNKCDLSHTSFRFRHSTAWHQLDLMGTVCNPNCLDCVWKAGQQWLDPYQADGHPSGRGHLSPLSMRYLRISLLPASTAWCRSVQPAASCRRMSAACWWSSISCITTQINTVSVMSEKCHCVRAGKCLKSAAQLAMTREREHVSTGSKESSIGLTHSVQIFSLDAADQLCI